MILTGTALIFFFCVSCFSCLSFFTLRYHTIHTIPCRLLWTTITTTTTTTTILSNSTRHSQKYNILDAIYHGSTICLGYYYTLLLLPYYYYGDTALSLRLPNHTACTHDRNPRNRPNLLPHHPVLLRSPRSTENPDNWTSSVASSRIVSSCWAPTSTTKSPMSSSPNSCFWPTKTPTRTLRSTLIHPVAPFRPVWPFTIP